MRPPKSPTSYTVIRPSVLASIVYFGLSSVWAIYTLCTAKFPAIDSTEPWRFLSSAQYLWVSVVNILFALAFLIDARATLRGPVEARRAHLTGLAFAAVILVLLQVGAHLAYGPITVG